MIKVWQSRFGNGTEPLYSDDLSALTAYFTWVACGMDQYKFSAELTFRVITEVQWASLKTQMEEIYANVFAIR